MTILKSPHLAHLLSVLTTACTAFALFLKMTFFSDYWSYVPVPASAVYGVIFALVCVLAVWLFLQTKNLTQALWLLVCYTAPPVALLCVSIIMRHYEYIVLKTTYAEFDIIVVLWFLLFSLMSLIRYNAMQSTGTIATQTQKQSPQNTTQNTYTQAFFFFVLTLTSLAFVAFGVQSLGRAAYVDERLWTYSNEKRIEKYWKNIGERDWAHTRPSDKPGVTLALLEGPSLYFVTPSRFSGDTITDKVGFTHMLFTVRLPLVLFGAVMLGIFYWISARLFAPRTALLSTLFIGTSPILIGMSRIVNPDALSWIFMPLTLLAYMHYRRVRNLRWIIVTGFLLGLGLLTKYIANIFFLFFLLILFTEPLFHKFSREALRRHIRDALRGLWLITLTALSTFAILYPGAWVRADRLLIGTLWSEPLLPFWYILLSFLIGFWMDAFFNRAAILSWIASLLQRMRRVIVYALPLLFFLSIITLFLAVFAHFPSINFENILSSPKTSANPDGNANSFAVIITSLYAAFFGIHPIALLGTLYAVVRMLFIPLSRYKATAIATWHILLFIAFYYVGSIVSTTVPTVRYQIIIYPLAFILSGIGYAWLLRDLVVQRLRRVVFTVFTLVTLTALTITLLRITPLYFSYNSALLPRERIINPKDMGDGNYEAAAFLNALPNAKNLIVWSDKNGVCAFFVGKCSGNIRKRDFIAHGPHYDYFVISRGREKRTRGLAAIYSQNRADYPIRFEALYDGTAQPVFEYTLAGRPTNYIRIFAESDVHVWRGKE